MKFSAIKNFFHVTLISMMGCSVIVFTILYVETFIDGFWLIYKDAVVAVAVGIVSCLTVLTLAFFRRSNEFIYKLFLILVVSLFFISASLYLLKIFGILNSFQNVDDLRNYISSFGGFAIILFILIQFLQVVVLPIPAFITVGAGVLLFGPFFGALYSCVGIIFGSLLAFFFGKIFGVKVVKWLISEEKLNKGLSAIRGKDKVVLSFMFLFPFFPDDMLCFVAGITTISSSFFVVMTIITRFISVFVSAYSMNNSIIPYDTWWGILLWAVFFLLTFLATFIICKKGEKIEKFFSRFRFGKDKIHINKTIKDKSNL